MKIEKIEWTNKIEDVYDIEVPQYHNYALKNGVIVHNCAGWSLRQLLREGFNGVAGRVGSRPPKHFREALGQMANFLGILQAEWAGAQAFSSFDTYLAPYVFLDGLSDKDIKKAIKQFVYNLNVPSRWGQSPFTNVTLDITVPKDLRDNIPMINDQHLFDHVKGEEKERLLAILQERNPNIKELSDATYKDFVPEMERIIVAYYEIMTEGDKHGQPFTFPIPTVNITDDFKWDGKVADALFTNTAKVGSSYFQNFVGSQFKLDVHGNKVENPDAYKPDAVRSMCPLTSDTPLIVKISEHQDDFVVNTVTMMTIADVVENMEKDRMKFKVWSGDTWETCKPVKMPMTRVIGVETAMGTISMGENHLQPVKGKGSIPASDIRVGDWLPFNKKSFTEMELFAGGRKLLREHTFGVLYKRDDQLADYFQEDDQYHYYKVTSVNDEKCNDEFLYCLEVENDDHLFMLANGLVTHNCRLQLDLRELQKRGNGLFGSAELTGCYDDQTEVLTFNGWKLFKDVTKEDKVLSMNTETKQPEWVLVDETHQYHVSDDLMYFNRRGIEELAVTPNHRMVRTDRNGKIKIERADAVFSERKEYMVPSSNPILSSIDPELVQVGSYIFDASIWYKFLGIFIGDGCCRHEPANGNIHAHYEVIIAQRDTSEQYEEIKDVINSLGIKFVSNHRGFMIYDKEISNELSKYGKAVDKHAPKELFGYSNALIEQFIAGLRLTDYSKGYFYTVSKQLKDDIQTLLTLLGKHSYSRVGKHAGHQSTTTDGRLVNAQYDCYEINEMVIVNKSFMKKECETRHYEGMVYCLTVKHGTVCVRRNGAINWSGNSVGVVTINMARLGYRFANNLDGLMQELDKLLDNSKNTLEKKRVFITQLFDRGLYPYSKRYLPSFKNHFSTIGVNGMNEMVRNFTHDKEDIASPFGKKMCLDILNHIREKMRHYQEETGNLYNLEATPAEGTTYRFAKEDFKRYKGIIQAGTYPNIYYTNSSQLPVEYTDDPFKALDHQNECQTAYNGGTVLHMYMNEAIDSPDSCKKFVKTIIDNYQLPYITISPSFSCCRSHGYLKGRQETCPKCGEKAECFEKTMGYIRRMDDFNIGKKGEHKDRLRFIQPSKEQLETIKK